MARDLLLIPGLLVYALAGRAALGLPSAVRDWAFAVVNVVAVGALYYVAVRPYVWTLVVYVALVGVQWALTRWLARADGRLPWIAFAFPLALLGLIRFAGPVWTPVFDALAVPAELRNCALFFVGISFMAFRLSGLVLEVRNGQVEPPTLARFIGFAFFAPALPVGPITPFADYDASLRAPDPARTPLVRSTERVIVGVTKYALIANLVNQIAYQGLVLDGRLHRLVDWPIAALAYYVYLYCNFSGFCDIAIGIGGWLGITVRENFDQPFGARNLQLLWGRWHITLGTYMREVLFTPLSKWLVGRLGPKRRDHAIAIALFTVFLAIGIWHGPTFNFVLFGLLNGVGVVAVHYWGVFLRKRLGRDGLRRYLENGAIRAVAIVATNVYFAAALAVFANTRSLARNLEFFFRH